MPPRRRSGHEGCGAAGSARRGPFRRIATGVTRRMRRDSAARVDVPPKHLDAGFDQRGEVRARLVLGGDELHRLPAAADAGAAEGADGLVDEGQGADRRAERGHREAQRVAGPELPPGATSRSQSGGGACVPVPLWRSGGV